jgi:undecaprenyl diphosphate synthase
MTREEILLPAGTKVPDHIALILDGNRRWARARKLPVWEGHRAGFEAGMKVAKAARSFGVHTFTVWGFSTENWDRSAEEISYLMTLYRKMVDEVRKEAKKEGIRFVHLGRKDRFPADLVKYIGEVEEETKNNDKHVFNVALDYGGRDEIVRAINKLLAAGETRVDEKTFAKYLDTGDQPYPYVDLFIRTSGEQRTSGLLPWQMTYAEFYWELDHLPDMTPEKLREAIIDFSRRRRRFGGNDKEEHLKFDPKLMAEMEIEISRLVEAGHGAGTYGNQRLRDLAIRYLAEQYGLSKELTKEAGKNLLEALVYRRQENWTAAKKALVELYGLVKKNIGLAMEPEIIANVEIGWWKNGGDEKMARLMLAEKFRGSELQMSKSAHLACLADEETGKKNFEKARGYWEKFYAALKDRVA